MNCLTRFLSCVCAFLLVTACSDTEQETGGTQLSNADTIGGSGAATGSWFDDKTPGDETGTTGTETGTDTGTKPAVKPLALVYEANPIDTPDLSEVELTDITAEDYALKGLYANVRNCLPVLETGQKIPINQGGFALNITT